MSSRGVPMWNTWVPADIVTSSATGLGSCFCPRGGGVAGGGGAGFGLAALAVELVLDLPLLTPYLLLLQWLFASAANCVVRLLPWLTLQAAPLHGLSGVFQLEVLAFVDHLWKSSGDALRPQDLFGRKVRQYRRSLDLPLAKCLSSCPSEASETMQTAKCHQLAEEASAQEEKVASFLAAEVVAANLEVPALPRVAGQLQRTVVPAHGCLLLQTVGLAVQIRSHLQLPWVLGGLRRHPHQIQQQTASQRRTVKSLLQLDVQRRRCQSPRTVRAHRPLELPTDDSVLQELGWPYLFVELRIGLPPLRHVRPVLTTGPPSETPCQHCLVQQPIGHFLVKKPPRRRHPGQQLPLLRQRGQSHPKPQTCPQQAEVQLVAS